MNEMVVTILIRGIQNKIKKGEQLEDILLTYTRIDNDTKDRIREELANGT